MSNNTDITLDEAGNRDSRWRKHITAGLMNVAKNMKSHGWNPARDWEITLKGELKFPLTKTIRVSAWAGDMQLSDDILTTVHLLMNDEIGRTFFPEGEVFASIHIDGGDIKDAEVKLPSNIALTRIEVGDNIKIAEAARRLDRSIVSFIQDQFDDYTQENAEQIQQYHQGEWRADDDAHRNR
jgi:hypothetical protein